MKVAIQDPITGAALRVNEDGTISISGTSAPVEGGSPTGNLDAATETTLAAILEELSSKYEGQDISVTITNFPAIQPVSGDFYPTTQPISGSVSVTNHPAQTALTDSQLRATPLPVTGTFYPATQPVSGTVGVNNFPATQPVSGSLSVSNFPATQPISGTITIANPVTPSTHAVTATGAAAAAVTLTLPAVAASFHYLTRLEICLYSTAARAGSATPVLVTTTNLPGTPVFTFPSAGAIGTVETRILELHAAPLKSSAVNVNTTIVCPVVTAGIWRINATYFLGA